MQETVDQTMVLGGEEWINQNWVSRPSRVGKCVSVTNQDWTVTHLLLEAYYFTHPTPPPWGQKELILVSNWSCLWKRCGVEWIKNQAATPGATGLIKYVQEVLDWGVGNHWVRKLNISLERIYSLRFNKKLSYGSWKSLQSLFCRNMEGTITRLNKSHLFPLNLTW